jgi:phage gpG-like protein
MEDGFKHLEKTFGAMLARSQNIAPALREIAPMFGSEIIENFDKGGRDNSGDHIWKKSQRAIRKGGQTLVDNTNLMKSAAVPRVDDKSITLGSDLPYARIHQFGGEIHRKEDGKFDKGRSTARGKGMTFGESVTKIDARPYLFISDKALDIAGRIIVDHTLTGGTQI